MMWEMATNRSNSKYDGLTNFDFMVYLLLKSNETLCWDIEEVCEMFDIDAPTNFVWEIPFVDGAFDYVYSMIYRKNKRSEHIKKIHDSIEKNIKGSPNLTLDEVYESADLVKEVVDPSCNIIFGSGIDPKMDDEVEITVIATGFSGSSVSEDMIEEVKRNITGVHITEEEEIQSAVEHPEIKETIPTSRVEIDDSDIPSFIKKLKNRF